MFALIDELMQVPRSLSGDGVRLTFERLSDWAPLHVTEVPTGTHLFDWQVPDEWNLRRARVLAPNGSVVLDTHVSTLHVVGYSEPVRTRLSLAELRDRVHSLPDHPDWVPFRTAYWNRTWGLCIAESALESLPDGDYEVVVDTTLEPGSMSYAEAIIGEGPTDVLLSTPSCHPALANDNLSAMVVLAALARELAQQAGLRHRYRVLWSPGTIGPLAWLAGNQRELDQLIAGYAVMCLGDPGQFVLKESRRGGTLADRAAVIALADRGDGYDHRPWLPWGGDERQFCSPGFDLPVATLTRTPPGEYSENHTSADDLSIISPDALAGSLDLLMRIVEIFERDALLTGTTQSGEPQLGRRGLTHRLGGQKGGQEELALLWVLSLADGEHRLLDVAERSGLPFRVVADAADALVEVELVVESSE